MSAVNDLVSSSTALEPSDFLPLGYASNVDSFVTSSLINFTIGFLLTLLFLVLRSRIVWLYSPRLLKDSERHTTIAPPPTLKNSLAFLSLALSSSEKDILEEAGPDALLLARFFRQCSVLFLTASLLGSIVLMVNANGGNGMTAFEALSIGNVPDESRALIAHALSVWLIHLFALYLMFRGWIGWVSMRHQWLAKIQSIDQNCTLLFNGVAKKHRATQALSDYFASLYPLNFHSAVIVQDVHKLTAILRRRIMYLKALEHAYGVWGSTGKRPQVREKRSTIENFLLEFMCSHRCENVIGMLCYSLRETVDGIEYYTYKLNKYNALVSKEQTRAGAYEPCHSGFISFKSALVANTAVRCEHNSKPFQYSVMYAPQVHDIHWAALILSRRERVFRSLVVYAVITLALVFWAFPIALVTQVSNLSSLSDTYKFLQPLVNELDRLRLLSFISGYLASLGLILVMLVLPVILRWMCYWQGIESHSLVQLSLLRKYYLFQVFNFFIINALSFSAFEVVTLLENSTDLTLNDILQLMSTTIPAFAPVFINFIMLRAMTGFPLQLARLWPLIWGKFSLRYACKTERERREVQAPPTIDYGEEYPEHLLIFTFGVTYAAIAPIALPFVFIYFFFGYITKVYQSLYMYMPRYESGGMHWPEVFHRMTFSLLLSQITMIGIFTVKRNPTCVTLMLPLPLVTFLVNRYVVRAYFEKGRYLPVELAEQVDRQRGSLFQKETVHNAQSNNNYADTVCEKKKQQGLSEHTTTTHSQVENTVPSPSVNKDGSSSLPEDTDAIQRSESDIIRKAKRQDRSSRQWGDSQISSRLRELKEVARSCQESPLSVVTESHSSRSSLHESLLPRQTSFHPSLHIQTASIRLQQEMDHLQKSTMHPYSMPEFLAPAILLPDIDAELQKHTSFASMIDAALWAQSAHADSLPGSPVREMEDKSQMNNSDNNTARIGPYHNSRSMNVSVDAGTALLFSPSHQLDITNYNSFSQTGSQQSKQCKTLKTMQTAKPKQRQSLFSTKAEWDREDDEEDDV